MQSVSWVKFSWFLVSVFATTACLQAQNTSPPVLINTAPQEQLATTLPAKAARDMIGGFWRTDKNFEPVLHIKNVLETSLLKVTPVLWMADGTEYDLSPITLDRAGVAAIDIRTALRDAPAEIAAHRSTYGSAGIRYTWNWDDAAIAMVTSTDEIDSLTYTTHLSAPAGTNPHLTQSSVQGNVEDGIWWAQTAKTIPFLTFVNSDTKELTAHISLSGVSEQSAAAKDITVAPGESRLVPLDDLLKQLPGSPRVGGVQVAYRGRPGSLVIEGGLEDADAGYSAPLPLLSLNARRVRSMISAANTTLAAVGVQVGAPEAKMQFPVGTTFTPYAHMRNLSPLPIKVEIGASYMSAGPRTAQLGSITLPGKEASSIELAPLLARAGLATYSGELNLTFSHGGAADNVLIATGSTARDSTYVFSVDPMILTPETGKIFCLWQVSGATDTMLSFWNSGSEAEDAELILQFKDGSYRYPVHLQANESSAVNVASIIHSGIPDADGHVIPSNVTEGSARLVNAHGRRKPFDVKAHAAIFNVQTATCFEPCPSCDSIVLVFVDPSPAAAGVGSGTQLRSYAKDKSGNSWEVTGSSSWSSANTSVVTVASSGMATGVSAGSANVTARYVDSGVPSWNDGGLCRYPLPQCPRYIGTPYTPVSSGKALPLTMANCTQVNNGAQVPYFATYGALNSQCTVTGQVAVFTVGQGTCVQSSNPAVDCWRTTSGNCTTTTCAKPTRLVNSSCSDFADKFPVGVDSVTTCIK